MKRTTLAVLMSTLLCSTAALAKNGADDPLAPCDDHGSDVCAVSVQPIAKNGADDPLEPCDDHGTDVCAVRAA